MVEPLRSAPRRPLVSPHKLPPLPDNLVGQKPPFTIPSTLDSLKSCLLKPLEASYLIQDPPAFPHPAKSAHAFEGGSTSAYSRLNHLLTSGAAASYKDTRNGLLGDDFSTKLSAWLAIGCISARDIHANLVAFEDGSGQHPQSDAWKSQKGNGFGAGENKGTAGIRFELLWRDYMRLCTRKFGSALFHISGFRADTSYPWKAPSEHPDILQRFLRGETGTGLIDASQRELFHTGYTSNRARQNVASFWAKHLGMDWRVGAEWYECCLVDYDVSSNWGNWEYVAGVGNDPRGESRVFNPIKQAVDYDPNGEYVKAWVKELRGVKDPQYLFQAWKIPREERKPLGLEGFEWVEKPLKKIDFHVNRRGGGGGNRGNGKPGESGRGKGGGRFGDRGRGSSGGRGHGRGRGGGKSGRMGQMDKERQVDGEDP